MRRCLHLGHVVACSCGMGKAAINMHLDSRTPALSIVMNVKSCSPIVTVLV